MATTVWPSADAYWKNLQANDPSWTEKDMMNRAAVRSGMAPPFQDVYAGQQAIRAQGSSGSSSTMSGNRSGRGSEAAGYIPEQTNIEDVQKQLLSGILANYPLLLELGNKLNKLTNDQAIANQRANQPGYDTNINLQTKNISDALQGKLSEGTVSQIAQSMAERGIGMGSPGSANTNAALARLMGRSAEELQASGNAAFEQQKASTPVGRPFDYASLIATMAQGLDTDMWNKILNASPDPAAAQANNMNMANVGLWNALNKTGSSSPNKGYFNSGNWLLDLLPRGNSTGAATTAVSNAARSAAAISPTAPANTPGWAAAWGPKGSASSPATPQSVLSDMAGYSSSAPNYYTGQSFGPYQSPPNEAPGGWDYSYTSPSAVSQYNAPAGPSLPTWYSELGDLGKTLYGGVSNLGGEAWDRIVNYFN